MKIPQSVHELIEKGPLAHLTTLNSSGGPQVTVVWVGIEERRIRDKPPGRAPESKEHPARFESCFVLSW